MKFTSIITLPRIMAQAWSFSGHLADTAKVLVEAASTSMELDTVSMMWIMEFVREPVAGTEIEMRHRSKVRVFFCLQNEIVSEKGSDADAELLISHVLIHWQGDKALRFQRFDTFSITFLFGHVWIALTIQALNWTLYFMNLWEFLEMLFILEVEPA